MKIAVHVDIGFPAVERETDPPLRIAPVASNEISASSAHGVNLSGSLPLAGDRLAARARKRGRPRPGLRHESEPASGSNTDPRPADTIRRFHARRGPADRQPN